MTNSATAIKTISRQTSVVQPKAPSSALSAGAELTAGRAIGARLQAEARRVFSANPPEGTVVHSIAVLRPSVAGKAAFTGILLEDDLVAAVEDCTQTLFGLEQPGDQLWLHCKAKPNVRQEGQWPGETVTIGNLSLVDSSLETGSILYAGESGPQISEELDVTVCRLVVHRQPNGVPQLIVQLF